MFQFARLNATLTACVVSALGSVAYGQSPIAAPEIAVPQPTAPALVAPPQMLPPVNQGLGALTTQRVAKPSDPSDRVLEPTLDPSRRVPLEPRTDPREGALVPTSYQDVLTKPPYDPPMGYAGRSSVIPRTGGNDEYEAVEDRWRIGAPAWDRYGKGHPRVFDYPYVLGKIYDPYNENVLKGDFPIYGQHTFLTLTANTLGIFEGRQIPTGTTPFESTARPFTTDFFGRPNQFLYSQFFSLSADLFHGDSSFKPMDWRVKFTPVFNVNFLDADELAVVNPDVRKGSQRGRSRFALQEWFAEYKIADLSPEYDFVSARVGSQPFSSDFRGFIFSDINRGARIFGTLNGNRDQFNLAFFRQLEKDTNSGLNTFEDRNQNILIGNYYRQDFLFPGYTIQGSVHYNNDGPDTLFDRNRFLVRPDPVGVFQPHRVEAAYLGFAGDGHIDRINISHAFYWAVGRDSRNPIAGKPQSISAQMAAVELSYDRDWARFRVSGFYASGDNNPNNGRATGFDGILDNTTFAGEFSFYNRQNLPLFGVQLVQRNSLYNSLRSSKIQGQSNFVNPGTQLINFGFDADVTPRFRVINNINFLWFDKTAVLDTFLFQRGINRDIGTDFSTAFEYRPVLNNNVIILGGLSALAPSGGFR